MSLAELVTFLVNKYFSNLISVLITYNSSSTSEVSGLFLDSVQASFQNLTQQGHFIGINWIDTDVLAKQEDLRGLLLQNADIGIEGYITILPSLLEFLNARLYATENSVLRLKDKYYLFLSVDENENPENVLTNEILKLYPHHLFVSFVKNSSDITFWTQKFVGASDNLKPIHLDTYLKNGEFTKNAELYPNKFLNMFGRILEVASVTYIPYVVSYSVAEGMGDVDNLDPEQPKKSVIYTGTEADIVLSFCRLRNCTIRVTPCGNDNWGGVYDNGSSDGLIGSVFRHETEFGIGCYYNWFNDLFETSIAIAKSAVPILAPAPSLYPAYMTIILPFNKLIWTMIIISIFVSAIVMHVIMYFNTYMEHREDPTKFHFDHASSYELTQFQMVAIFFQQSFSQSKLDRFATRFFLSTLLLAGITLENTYSGQLKSLLTIPAVTEPVDTIQKFAKTDWQWASPSGAWIFSIAFSDIPHEKIMTEKFVEMSYEQLRDASYTGNYGIGLERLHGGIYSFGNYIKDGNLDKLIMTKDDLYYDYSRGFAIRGWPLMDTFNTHILWCLEHGLYNYWEKKHVYYFLDRKTQGIMFNLASGHLQKFPPIPLTIANISGPLWALAIGYGMALIVLISEMFANGSNKFTKHAQITKKSHS
ncbi:uncharacterized protein LOC129948159 isoform X1 [Eupeodes corollae]|uniref:uncharacterized protein LOC129948159 isoform X1 n=1 Tax=Eupeodes corollae TaxID=290404 RepID=UPI00248F9021|nr:uncharacterized protein LOC129948159 isoform X1 [Eupeodes corollae]